MEKKTPTKAPARKKTAATAKPAAGSTRRAAATKPSKTTKPATAAKPRARVTKSAPAAQLLAKPVASAPPNRDQVAAFAYSLFEQSGYQHGRSMEYWLEAESRLSKGMKL